MSTPYVTPPAPCAWPKLGTPDVYINPNGEKGKPSHRVKVILDPSDPKHKKFIDKMNAIDDGLVEALAEKGLRTNIENRAVWRICRPQEDKDGNETGLYEVSFKRTVQGVKGGKAWEWPVPVGDRFGRAITSTEERNAIGGGSIIQVAFRVGDPYNKPIGAGFSVKFEQVLIRELREQKNEDDFSAFGDFDEAEENPFPEAPVTNTLSDQGGDY